MSRLGSSGKPSEILAQSVMTGLASLVRLAQARANSLTEKHIASMTETWNNAKQTLEENQDLNPHDFSPVQNIEHLLRQRWLDIIWHSTIRYGNREFKRVYDWRKGTIGPLNSLLNYAGARLRDLATTHYPFPEPQHYLVLGYPDGRKRTVPISRLPDDIPESVVKKHWRTGYPGGSKSPRFMLSHPTLPELDFVDMLRGHVQELCRQLFICNVSQNDSHRYIRLFVHRLKPFLDWFYSQGKIGRNNFYPDADRELRTIVLEIRAMYGRRSGRRQRLSRQLEESGSALLTVDILKAKALSLRNNTASEEIRDACDTILHHISCKHIREQDLERFERRISALSQQEGNDWHRILLSTFHHPRSLKSVVYAGDSMLENPADRQFFAELPIRSNSGQGSADLVLFIRRSIGQRVIWTPVMLLELKTKTSFDYDLYWVRPRTKKDCCTPVFHGWKKKMTRQEWLQIANSPPLERTQKQLELYEEALLRGYRHLVAQDAFAPSKLWKGVVVVDTSGRYESVLDALKKILSRLQANLKSIFSSKDWLSYTLGESNTEARIALLMAPDLGPLGIVQESVSAETIRTTDPFENRVVDDRIFTEYISVSSPTSGGRAAAWHAKNWHLLHHIQEVIQHSQRPSRVHWLDLLGSFPEPLRAQRFGLEKEQNDLIHLLERIKFIDLCGNVESFLQRGSNVVQGLSSIHSAEEMECVIVVDGWADLNQMVPLSQRERLLALECTILDALPQKNVNIIWVDNGVKTTKMNETYQRACLDVLPYDSPRRFQLDEVIWNMPTPPRVLGWQTPYADEKRIVVQDTPTSAPPWKTMIEVPVLRRWARKFRGLSKRDKQLTAEEVIEDLVTKQSMYGRNVTLSSIQRPISHLTTECIRDLQTESLMLAPSLLRSRNEFEGGHEAEPEITEKLILRRVTKGTQTLFLRERLHLSPIHPPPTPRRATEAKMYARPVGTPRYWYHKTRKKPDRQGSHYTRKPPMFRKSELMDLDSRTARRREIRRIRDAAKFLKNHLPVYEDMYGLCRQLYLLCQAALDGPDDADEYLRTLYQVRDQILRNSSRARGWLLIQPAREALGDVLTAENRLLFADLCVDNPDIPTLYGNNLLLAVMTALVQNSCDEGHQAVIPLWKAVAEWELYQIGFTPAKHSPGIAQSVYDFHAIYANLLSRAKYLTGKDTRQENHSDEQPPLPAMYRPGLLVGDEEHLWLLFKRSDGQHVCGLMKEVQESLRWGFQWCISNPAELSDGATELLEASCFSIETPLAVTTVDGHDILWAWSHDDNEWCLLGRPEYRVHEDMEGIVSLLWVRISPISSEESLVLTDCPTGKPIHSFETFSETLEKLANQQHRVVQVICEVDVDKNEGTYVVRCKSSGIIHYEYKTTRTREVVEFLRSTALEGRKVTTQDGTTLTWSHLTDIEYEYVERGGFWISLTFLKPLVHRRRFFENYIYPESVNQLLSIQGSSSVVMHICYNEEAMAMHKSLHPVLSIRFDSLPSVSQLKKLETERMNIYDVALLAEVEQFIDVSTRLILSLRVDVRPIEGIRLPVSLQNWSLASLLSNHRNISN